MTQQSCDNPGWIGIGVPSIYSLCISRPKRAFAAAISNPKEAKNLLLASVADLFNFHINRRNRARCNCCGWSGSGFLSTYNWRAVTYHSRCPQCDSRSRHRGLTAYLQMHQEVFEGRTTLIFAPENVVLNALNKIAVSAVTTTDYLSTDVDLPNQDIQHLRIESCSYDLLICNHVLEHVVDDGAAIAECHRVLKPNGIGLFTIPGNFDGASTWTFSSPDSNGHYRHYGMDILEKFKASFETVQVLDMSSLVTEAERVRNLDMLFICTKVDRSV